MSFDDLFWPNPGPWSDWARERRPRRVRNTHDPAHMDFLEQDDGDFDPLKRPGSIPLTGGPKASTPPWIAYGEVTTKNNEQKGLASLVERVHYDNRTGRAGLAIVHPDGRVEYHVFAPDLRRRIWTGYLEPIPRTRNAQVREDAVRRVLTKETGQLLQPHSADRDRPDLLPVRAGPRNRIASRSSPVPVRAGKPRTLLPRGRRHRA